MKKSVSCLRIVQLLAVIFLLSARLSAQSVLTYGLVQDPANPLTVTAIATPNFSASNATIQSGAVFTVLIPAGTTITPAIPVLPANGNMNSITGSWRAERITAAYYAASCPGSNPADLGGHEVYRCSLTSSPNLNVVSGQPVRLFSFSLTADCAGSLPPVRILQNGSTLQQAVATHCAGFALGNVMTIAAGTVTAGYIGNLQGASILTCPLSAPSCPMPVNLSSSNVSQESMELRWTSQNTPVDNCWTIVIGGLGIQDCDDHGHAVVNTNVCFVNGVPVFSAPVSSMQVVNQQVRVVVGGLQPGTRYHWFVSETCDGLSMPANVSACAGPGLFTTLDAPYTVTSTVLSRPSCPFSSPGYVADGSFRVTIADGTTCTGTYMVTATPVVGSGPGGSTPPNPSIVTYIGMGQGNFQFNNVGAGAYSIAVTETGPCNPPAEPTIVTVTVANGTDVTRPVFYVYDLLGNIVVDNDPATAPGTALNMGTLELPEGACGRQDIYYVYGFDNCDGVITTNNALSALVTTTPSTIQPATQVNFANDGAGFYVMDVHWSTGNTTIAVRGRDVSGNIANGTNGLQLIANIRDNIVPQVVITTNTQFVIPVCATSVSAIVTFQLNDRCDQDIINWGAFTPDFGGATATLNYTGVNYREYTVDFPAAGSYLLAATYTDPAGNVGFLDQLVTVQQAADNQPPAIRAAAESVTLPACAANAPSVYSFIVEDDCEPINLADLSFNGGTSGLPTLSGSGFHHTAALGANAVYVEVAGNLLAGTHQLTIVYQNIQLSPTLVVSQQGPQPADIVIAAANTFTMPACRDTLLATLSVTILDDCDNPVAPARASFSLGGSTVQPTYIDTLAGYFEFRRPLVAADSGKIFTATYVDAAGQSSSATTTLVINDQPDNWAPIIVYPSQDIIVNLPACDDPSATVVFEVTASDNCGVASLTSGFQPGVTSASIVASVGGARMAVLTAPGTYTVLLTATDVNGNTTVEDFRIIVNQPPRPVTNLGCLGNLNVTLGDDCKVLVTPQMVLSGNMGCVDPSLFRVTVEDANPSNGPIVDGCGVFPYMVTLPVPPPQSGFTGAFAPANWTLSPSAAGASASFNGNVLTLTTAAAGIPDGNDPSLNELDAFAAVGMPGNGNLRFDYTWTNADIDFDWFIIGVNGAVVAQGTASSAGVFNQQLTAGQVLIVGIDDDGQGPAGQELRISNWLFTPSNPLAGVSFTTCWGNLFVEDKTAPALTCPADTGEANVEFTASILSGSLGINDPRLDFSQFNCYLEILTSSSGASAGNAPGLRFYRTHSFQVSQTDTYTFDLSSTALDANNGGAMAALYMGNFNPAEPCSRILCQNDQVFGATADLFLLTPGAGFGTVNFNPSMRLSLELVQGQTYTLLTTSSLPGQTGAYSWAVYGDSRSSRLVNVPTMTARERRELICNDIDQVKLSGNVPAIDENGNLLPSGNRWCYRTDRSGNVVLPSNPTRAARMQQLINALLLTGFPHNGDAFGGALTDNCGNIRVCVTEVVNKTFNCTASTIQRTFTAQDKLESTCTGNPMVSSCTQQITFRKPNVQDIQFPPFTAFLECGQAFTTNAAGNPNPRHSGYPFIRTAFGNIDLDQTICNLGTSYADQGAVPICTGARSVIRRWTVLDFCAPTQSRIFNQLVTVGDYSAPQLTAATVDYNLDGTPDMLSFPSSALSCAAYFQLPMPASIGEFCSSATISVDVLRGTTGGVVIASGSPSQLVGPIEKGSHRLRYTAVDGCGNSSQMFTPFQIIDEVAPTAQCDNALHVSLTGPVGQAGLVTVSAARVFATDIDEGSRDNCSTVRYEVRRRVDAGVGYGCLNAFDYNNNGTIINDEVRLSAPSGQSNVPNQYFTPWREFIDATCCDVSGLLRIELRVWDDANTNNLFGSWYGNDDANDDGLADIDLRDNFNVCWMDVVVEDKVNPTCTAPQSMTVSCSSIPATFPTNLATAWTTSELTTRNVLNDAFGQATGSDNCIVQQIVELAPLDQRDDCGYGTITRRFQVIDAQGLVSLNNCRQLITINEVHNYEIKFPRDAMADCSAADIPGIETRILGCDLLAISGANGENDERFTSDGLECFKIRRTYRVINWCQWDGESPPVVISRDEDCDNLGGDEDVWVLVRTVAGTATPANPTAAVVYLDRDNNELNNLPATGTNRCNTPPGPLPSGHWSNSQSSPTLAPPSFGNPQLRSYGYYEYSQFIKIFDSSAPEVTVEPFSDFCSFDNLSCSAQATFNFTVADGCGLSGMQARVLLDLNVVDTNQDGQISPGEFSQDANLSATVVSQGEGSYSLTGNFPIGRHALLIAAADGCSNNGQGRIVIFNIKDCKATAPSCLNGLTAALSNIDHNGDGTPDGAVTPEIWPSEFVNALGDDCTGPLKLAVYTAQLPPGVAPDPVAASVIQFDCDDFLANGGSAGSTALIPIFVYAIDGAGNYDFCQSFMVLQDPNGLCTQQNVMATVSGAIFTEEDEPVQGVTVTINGQVDYSMTTGGNGRFEFQEIETGYDYTISASMNANATNGVSTLDLVLINKHILQAQRLDSPYKLIAADANRSGSITTLDLVQIRRLVLNIANQLPNNTSWRFIDANYDFPDPDNPWLTPFPELINLNNLSGSVANRQFVAIKVGDVNNSAAPNLMATEERSTKGKFYFEVADVEMQAGETYTIPVTAAELAEIEGYQFTLQVDAARINLLEVVPGIVEEGHYNDEQLANGVLTMSWNWAGGRADEFQDTGEPLFSLKIRPLEKVRLSEVMGITSRYTHAEAYTPAGDRLDPVLNFLVDAPSAEGFALYQNVPNPFSDVTIIGFMLPEDQLVTMNIQDALGRVVKTIREHMPAGRNEIQISAGDLGGTGVFYYTLSTGEYTATRKMVVTK